MVQQTNYQIDGTLTRALDPVSGTIQDRVHLIRETTNYQISRREDMDTVLGGEVYEMFMPGFSDSKPFLMCLQEVIE